MSEKPKKFWMVYGIGCDRPKCQHESYELAHNEAKRLARLNAGVHYIVLEAVAAVFKQDVVTVSMRAPSALRAMSDAYRRGDDIPF